MKNTQYYLERSIVPSFKLISLQSIIFPAIFLAGLHLWDKYSGRQTNPSDFYLFIYGLTSIVFFSSLNFLIYKKKKIAKKILESNPDLVLKENGIVLPVNPLMLFSGNFYKKVKNNQGKVVKAFCYGNLFKKTKCFYFKYAGSYYAITFD